MLEELDINLDSLEEQELLSCFKNEEGISVERISDHLFRSGVLVKLIIGRKRLKFSYDFKGLGIDFEKTNSKDFVLGHMENGKISVLPLHLEKRLTSIEGALRNRQKRLSTGFNDQYMPLENYTEFKKDFETTRQEFFMVRDEILDIWENLIEEYKLKLDVLLKDVNAIERDRIYREMVNVIPSKQEYKDSFKMLMSVKTMPRIEADDDLNDEIANIIKKDIVGVIYETVQRCLDKACSLANSAVSGYSKGEISIRTLGAIKRISTTLRTNNVVANNDVVEEIAVLFDEAANLKSPDEISQIMEIILAKGYVYANKNSITLSFNPVLPSHELERIYNLL